VIPESWDKKPLSKIATIQTGIAKGSKNIRNPVKLPYLRVANVQDGYLDLSHVKTIEVDRTKVDRYRLKIGDVLLTEGGDFDKLGRGTVWNGEIKECVHQNHVFVARPNPNVVLPKFLSLLTGSPYGKAYFQKCSKQSTNLASINSTQLKGFPVLIPPLSEQAAIADLLSTWDAAIEKTEKLIAVKGKRYSWLQNNLITHHSTSGSYKTLRLRDILTESRLPDLEGDPKKRLTVRLHLKGVAAREYRGTEADGATTFYKRRAGQFIYGKQNVFKGSLGIVPPELDGFSSMQDIPAFDIDDYVVSTDWLYFYFSRPSFYKRLEVYADQVPDLL